MALGGEKWPVGTTKNTDLEPVNWNKVAWEPDVAGSPTNPGRQTPPAGSPGRSPPSALPPPTASRALQVTQLHSHSDATTLAAITAQLEQLPKQV